ncbi:peptidoglycan DD-metalloendopeptidase family protein [Candidatus Dojkabacteria bacterium]|uniref:Peptidoglycan DD-metalloendopeptidase family protein n=1 Tax=Candidatus Dojkabacteria bacterium TaxID=2099670 RepID=A0A955L5D2_9BACT|nr:peptidoglycan DD-metalloendopeptidase family protein [Candidatus Dojkabacteria bacterium]
MALSPKINRFTQPQPKQAPSRPIPVEFVTTLSKYLALRGRQLTVGSLSLGYIIATALDNAKAWAVRRMFWGRSSLYRSAFHVIVSIITVVAVLSGITNRLNISSSAETGGLDLESGILGRQDIFSQSGTAESIGAISEDEKDYPVYKHVVQRGETLSEVAEIYSIKVETIKWANSLTSETLKVGQVLRIPGIDGVFVKVKDGDTLEKIAERNKGNVFDIIDLNSNVLDRSNPVLSVGMELFIPNGIIPAPVVAVKPVTYVPPAPSNPGVGDPGGIDVAPGTFVHPLSTDPACGGWTWSRGFSAWHRGADLAKRGGCWINAAGSGTVITAGWGSAGQGYHVVIDHGGGIRTLYYHGSGAFNVSVGQQVKAGQKIMYMGCTGYCTGTHLHFEFRINNVKQNPEAYIRLR